MKTFSPISVSSKFGICGLPIRIDTYKTCSFGCEYCFANNRIVMGFDEELQVADVKSVERRLSRIFDKGIVKENNLLDVLIADGVDWHFGGMSDPLQPAEAEHHITKQLIDVTNQYGIHMVISTKSDNLYGCDFRPDLHSFQLSVTNVHNRTDLEANVPDIQERYKLYRYLKDNGFKVGIRVQPFIPGVTTTEIIDMFHDADNFTIEGLKLVPQNKEHKELVLQAVGLERELFVQKGLLNLKPEYRLSLYKPFIDVLEERGIRYSIADNDLHYMGNNCCCCGDNLVHKATTFNNTALYHTVGRDYCLEDIKEQLDACNVSDCKCKSLFSSNRQDRFETVEEFMKIKFDSKANPVSHLFQHNLNNESDI